MTAPLSSARFRVVRRLGSGGCGEVFLADDTASGRRVAIKRPLAADPEATRLLAHEFALVAALDHPGVARALDFVVDREHGETLLVLEAIAGESSDAARWNATPPTLLGWAAGVAETLAFLHGVGLVHGDIKPENVFITEDRYPRLIDFGLARRVGEIGGGTTATAAPEMLEHRPSDERSDLYCLGATLYFWLYGRFPFGASLDARLAALRRRPVMPNAPELPAGARALLRELLAPEPGERPQSAREVVERLAHLGVALPHAILADPSARALALPLVERAGPIAALARACANAAATSFVALVGESGTGRSRLAAEAARLARIAGRCVIELCGDGPESAGARVLAALTAMRPQGLLELGNPSLGVALHLCDTAGPTALIVDDAERLSSEDFQELQELPTRLAGAAQLCVVAVFSEPVAQEGWESVSVAPLSVDATAAMAEALLPGAPVSPLLAERLTRLAHGAPRRIVAALVEAARRGWLQPRAGGWNLDALETRALEPLAEPRAAAREALAALPPALRRVAGALAVHGGAVLAEALAQVMATDDPSVPDTDEPGAVEALRDLAARGLVDRDLAGRWKLLPWVPALADVDATAARAWHARWREALSEPEPAAPFGEWLAHVAQLARHALGAGRRAAGARLARAAVRRALSSGRPDLAANVLATLPVDATQADDVASALLAEASGEIALARGRAERAVSSFARAHALLAAGGLVQAADRVALRRARALGEAGQIEAARTFVAPLLSTGDDRAAQAWLEDAVLHARRSEYAHAQRSCARGLALAPPGSLVAARLHATRGRCSVLAGAVEEAEADFRAAAPAAEADRAFLAALMLARIQAAERADRPREVLEQLAQARALLIARGDADGLALLTGIGADAALACGDWEQAAGAARESLRWRTLTGHTAYLAACVLRTARVHLVAGDLASARGAVQHARRLAQESDDTPTGAQCHALLSAIDRLSGDTASAVRNARRALAWARAQGQRSVLWRAQLALAAARLAEGRHADCAALVREILEAKRVEGERAPATGEELALLARASAEPAPAEALRLADRALRVAEREGDFDAVQTALAARAAAHAARGETSETQRTLERARIRILDAAARCASPAAAADFRARPDRAALLEADGMTQDARRLASLYSIVADLNSQRDAHQVVERLLDRALAELTAERGAVVLAGASGEFDIVARRQLEPETALDALALSRHILERASGGEAILAADPAADPRFASAASVRLFAIRAVLCVPLRWRERAVGAIYVDSRDPGRRFARGDVRFLEALAHHAALALENARAFARLQADNERLRSSLAQERGLCGLVGRSAAMQALFKAIRTAAPTPLSVLVTGESGTGKELIARAVHRLGAQPEGPFVAVNCSAVPETILEALLFGHERGAFTGADRAREGLIAQAHGGTLFLDELGDMPPGMQAALLRVLEERVVRPLGSTKSVPVSFRLVAATSRDPLAAVREGRFRHDLLYRVDVLRLEAPPLRTHLEDLPPLVEHLAERLAADWGALRVDRALVARLATWTWPGNVRELENVLARLALQARAGVLDERTLARDAELAQRFGLAAAPAAQGPTNLDVVERDTIQRALELAGGNRERAARLLGVGRATIFRKIRQYGLKPE